MKRCPQCEFIYEEDQRLCDMDGTLLVHDPGVLPERAPLQIRTSSTQIRPSSKSVTKVMAQAGIPLVILGILAFYVFSVPSSPNKLIPRVTTTANGARSAVPTSSPSENQATETDSAPAMNGRVPPESRQTSDDPATVRENKQPFSRIKPASPSPKRSRTEPQANSKKDSKVTSFLKKTGRFLKKPFQL